jgi:hypothetical protein
MKSAAGFLRSFLIIFILILSLQMIACGTLIYPERRGQTSGQIDPAIAILDGVGILFFVVPGLVAFAVDFATGAIYLPGSRKRKSENGQPVVVRLEKDQLTMENLEIVISRHVGHPFTFERSDLQTYRLDGPECIPMDLICGI